MLETAGMFWAVEKINGIRAVSNVMSVSKYDRIHPEAIPFALSQGWCESEGDFNFCTVFLDHFHKTDMGATLRAGCTSRTLMKSAGSSKDRWSEKALRSHNGNDVWTGSGYSSPCMHASGAGGCQSTNSMIAELRGQGKDVYYGTGMSTPCIAPFRPFWFDAFSERLVFPYDMQEKAMDSWLYREQINRAMVLGMLEEEKYRQELAALENRWGGLMEEVDGKDAKTRKEYCDSVAREEEEFFGKWVDVAKGASRNIKGGKEFQEAWAYWNEKLGADRRISV